MTLPFSRAVLIRLRRLVVLLTALAAAVFGMGLPAPAPAGAEDGATVVLNPRPGPNALDLVQLGLGTPYVLDPDQWRALHALEQQALATVAERHGLDLAANRELLLRYARAEVRAELVALVVAAAAKAPTARSADEQTALGWVGQVQRTRNIEAAEAALAQHAAWEDNYCTYRPPAPFRDEYNLSQSYQCNTTMVNPYALPKVPTAEQFTTWGLAAIDAEANTPEVAALDARTAAYLYASAASAGTVLGTVGALALPGVARVVAAAIFPYSFAKYLAGGAFFVGAAAALAATVMALLTVLIYATINFVNGSRVDDDLRSALAKAEATHPDGASVVNAPGGYMSLVHAIGRVSDRTPSAWRPVPAPAPGDLITITDQSGRVVSARTDSMTYLSVARTADDALVTQSRTSRLVGGWFSQTAPVAEEPTQQLTVSLWDPEPVTSSGVTTDRAGFGYPAVVSRVVADGRSRWLALASDRPGYPQPDSDCDDYHEDGCWLTDELPYLSPGGGTLPLKRYAALTSNAGPPPFEVTSDRSPIASGDVVTLTASDSGVPLTTDEDGDSLTVRWEVACSTCPESDQRQEGSTATLHFTGSGSATVTVTATDPFGVTQIRTRTFHAGAPADSGGDGGGDLPAVVIDREPPTEARRGSAVQLAGRVLVWSIGAPDTLTVDWGDGSGPVDVSPSGGGAFAAEHRYDRTGEFVITLTRTLGDGCCSWDVQRRVSVVNTSPTISYPWVGMTAPFTPGDWHDLAPGTGLTLRGELSDPDVDDDVTVTARWYDGVEETVRVGATGRATRAFQLSRTVTARTAPGDVPLVTLHPSDGQDAAGGASSTITGSVLNVAPSFTDLAGTPGTAGGAGTDSTVTGALADANGDGTRVEVDWGDGTAPGLAPTTGAGSAFSLAHRYAAAGDYTVTVTASDGVDTTTETTRLVVPAAPVTGTGAGTGAGTGVGTGVGIGSAAGPQLEAPQRVRAERGRRGGPLTVTVSWRPPAQAGSEPVAGYRIRAERTKGGTVVAVRRSGLVRATSRSLWLDPGRWTVRVRAVTASAVGPWSAPAGPVRPR